MYIQVKRRKNILNDLSADFSMRYLITKPLNMKIQLRLQAKQK
jgi:hypothetical protein